MAKWTIPDMISRAEADRQKREAVAAALMEAADLVDALSDDILDGAQACADTHPAFSDDRQEHAEDARQVAVRIRALITDDAQTALTKMLAEARAEGMREAASDLLQRHVTYMTSKGRNPADYSSQFSLAHDAILDAIQKEGGA